MVKPYLTIKHKAYSDESWVWACIKSSITWRRNGYIVGCTTNNVNMGLSEHGEHNLQEWWV